MIFYKTQLPLHDPEGPIMGQDDEGDSLMLTLDANTPARHASNTNSSSTNSEKDRREAFRVASL